MNVICTKDLLFQPGPDILRNGEGNDTYTGLFVQDAWLQVTGAVSLRYVTRFAKGHRAQPVAWHAEAPYAWRPVLLHCVGGLPECPWVQREHSLHTDAALLSMMRSSDLPPRSGGMQTVSSQARQGLEAQGHFLFQSGFNDELLGVPSSLT
jgi:hypothetical protein